MANFDGLLYRIPPPLPPGDDRGRVAGAPQRPGETVEDIPDAGGRRPGGEDGVRVPFVPLDYPEVDSLVDSEELPVITAWGVQVSYEWDEGLRYAPVAGSRLDRRAAVWRTHSGVCIKVVSWVAQTVGDRPILPSPGTGSLNEVLISKGISPALPTVLPMGDQGWTVAGVYRYVLLNPPAAGDTLGTGGHPLSLYPASANQLQVSDFRDLLDAASVQAFNGQGVDY